MANAKARKRVKAAKPGEIVSYDSRAYVGLSKGPRYNPDDLIGARGLLTYKKMRLDEQVKAVVTFKRDAIFARGWQFTFDEETKLPVEEQKARIDTFCRIVNKISGAFIDGLNCIATGREFGYSLTEKVYGLVDGANPAVGVSKLLGRDPTTFIFVTDEKGELVSCHQNVGGKKIDIDLSKFIHYAHNPEFDQYFGRSDMREAYKAWFWKTKMMDFWMVYGERLAGGFASVEIDSAANITLNSPAWAKIVDVVNNLSSVNGVALPPGCKLNISTPPTSDFYQKTIEFFDLAIARASLVPNLLGVSHTGQTGAYSQSQTQLEAFFWTLNTDKQRLESVLNEQLFADLGDQNWGDGDYPQFKFKELSQERLRWIVETWTKLVTGGSVIATEKDEKHIRDLMEMPEREEGDEALAKVKQDLVPIQIDPNKPVMPPGGLPTDPNSDGAPATKAYVRELFEKHKQVPLIEEPEIPDRSKFAATMRAAQRVHFSVIRDRQQSGAAALARETTNQLARAVSNIIGSDEQLAVTLADPEQVESAVLTDANKRKLNATYTSALGSAYAMGEDLARNELQRAHAQFKREDKLPLVFADLRNKARDWLAANGYRMAGNVADATRAIVQGELQNAIKYGKSPTETRQAIYKALMGKGLLDVQSLRGVESDELISYLDVEGETGSASYLETLARTNLFEAMNEARFAEFTDPAVSDFVEGLEYSAILDDRTTEICQHLDDSRYRTDSAYWDRIRPPNHYNCRSILIPITSLDGWDGVESAAPSVDPQEGFK